jgi:hypothetical protein
MCILVFVSPTTQKNKNLQREYENSSSHGEAFVCIQAVTTSTLLQTSQQKQIKHQCTFPTLPVQAPYSYKTVLCCSLTSGLTLLSTNNFPTYYIALLFYLKILVATSCWIVCQTKVPHTYLFGIVAAGSGK